MNRTTALLTVAPAGIFWASGGVAVQDFFAHTSKTAMELTNIRMTSAGFLMLLIAWKLGGLSRSVAILNRKPKLWLDTALYGAVGVVIMQFTYFKGIETGGAAPATVIQYACPAFVVIWQSIYNRRLPKLGEVIAVVLAMLGVLLLVTGGDFTKMLVPLECIAWSLTSGAAFAFSAIYPKHLFAMKIDQYSLTALGMIIGGLATFGLIDNADWRGFFDAGTRFDVIWIILIATVGAFLCFNAGLKYLTPEEASVTATTEPAASVVISFFMFGTVFGSIELIGVALVIIAILCPTFIKR